MSKKAYRVIVPVEVTIIVTDEPAGDGDPLHPLDPRRMEGIYDCEDPRQMLVHLAYNAISNHKECASGLDGWGDIRVATDVEGFDEWPTWRRLAYVRDHHPVRMTITDVDTFDAEFIDEPPTTDDVQRSAEHQLTEDHDG